MRARLIGALCTNRMAFEINYSLRVCIIDGLVGLKMVRSQFFYVATRSSIKQF
jgi:hypothetical protein